MAKHEIKVFSATGDTTVAEWDVADESSVEVAKGVFDAARADGYAAVTLAAEGAARLDTFSPEANEIYLLKPIAGG